MLACVLDSRTHCNVEFADITTPNSSSCTRWTAGIVLRHPEPNDLRARIFHRPPQSRSNGNIYGQPTSNPTRFNIDMFKGPAGFDIRQRLSASYTFETPWRTHNRVADLALSQWQLSGIVTADTGVLYYVFLTTDNENIGIAAFGSPRYTEFPNLACDPNNNYHPTTAAWFNIGCYQLPAFGTRGSAGRHALYSDGLLNWDASAAKQWPLTETKAIQFRAEFFNAANGATFDPPGILFGSPTFGKVSNTTRQPGRQIHFALKFHF